MRETIESKDFWEQQLEKLKASGLSRTQYCHDTGINYARFTYWVKRLQEPSSTFIPVKVQTLETSSQRSPLCTLELRGLRLEIHELKALAFVLERLV